MDLVLADQTCDFLPLLLACKVLDAALTDLVATVVKGLHHHEVYGLVADHTPVVAAIAVHLIVRRHTAQCARASAKLL